MGLRSLRISSSGSGSASASASGSSDEEERCDSSLGLEEDRDFPVEILPFLFLGNAANSEDSEALQRHQIQVSVDIDFVYIEWHIFSGIARKIKYMRASIVF